ncbi:MAG: Gfo/Idh/MocA family oxidoreductase, partial [Rhodothermales bacterium]
LGADLAIVATPPRYHAAHTKAALEAGLSVLCEKPMATSIDEGRAMVDAAKAADRVLAVGFIRRFLPTTGAIHTLLRRGLLGEVTSVTGFEGDVFRWPVSSPDYFSPPEGGVLSDIGSHALDLLRWWMGDPEEIEYEDDATGGVEVNCRIRMKWAGGATGMLRLSRDWARPNEYHIQCTGGWIRWCVDSADTLQIGIADGRYGFDARIMDAAGDGNARAATFEDGFAVHLRNVAAAHRGRAVPVVPGEEGLQNLRLIERCRQQRKRMLMPWLSEAEWSGASRRAGGSVTGIREA